MARVQCAGVFGVVWILQIVGGVGGDAVFGDLVFSDFGVACWIAPES